MSASPNLLTDKRIEDLLALRGFLDYQTLFTAMEKRHRVNYGVKRSVGSKRIAVPFKASDTPSERSEFNHPDVAILLTTLSYYYDGLSRAEVVEAFWTLLGLNKSAQTKIYAQWFDLCEERPTLIDCVDKLDLSNDEQVNLLQQCFSHNRETVNFWLNACVLPNETKQYSHKLIANSSNSCMGFAGTDDTSYLLPLQVAKHNTMNPRLRATNGLMLARLLSPDAQFSPLHSQSSGSISVKVNNIATLFDRVLESKCRALIDVGALCTGSSNLEVADHLLARIDQTQFSGVVYFDDELSKWCVKDFVGSVAPLSESHLHECDCLVFFDESRCRGADMKLLQTAHGLLTLGPKMCKDKLMQAVGRLRQFGKGQTVTVVAADDVTQQIMALNGLSLAKQIVNNTVETTKSGMSEWAYQGLYFSTTYGHSDLVRLEEKCSLHDYYTEVQTTKTVSATVERFKDFFSARIQSVTGILPRDNAAIVAKLINFTTTYGSDVFISGSTNEEEAEKQLEKEVEKEIEKEVQLPAKTAVLETDWRYEPILFASGATFSSVETSLSRSIFPLIDAVKALCSSSLGLSSLPWASANVYCTANHAHTIAEQENMEEYLRTTDVCLHFTSTGQVLLLSDREADAVLALMLQHKGKALSFTLTHLSEIKHVISKVAIPCSTAVPRGVPSMTAFLLMLFEGETSFPKGSVAAATMDKVLRGQLDAQSAALKIPVFRGKSHLLAMSDLEEACMESM